MITTAHGYTKSDYVFVLDIAKCVSIVFFFSCYFFLSLSH